MLVGELINAHVCNQFKMHTPNKQYNSSGFLYKSKNIETAEIRVYRHPMHILANIEPSYKN